MDIIRDLPLFSRRPLDGFAGSGKIKGSSQIAPEVCLTASEELLEFRTLHLRRQAGQGASESDEG